MGRNIHSFWNQILISKITITNFQGIDQDLCIFCLMRSFKFWIFYVNHLYILSYLGIVIATHCLNSLFIISLCFTTASLQTIVTPICGHSALFSTYMYAYRNRRRFGAFIWWSKFERIRIFASEQIQMWIHQPLGWTVRIYLFGDR